MAFENLAQTMGGYSGQMLQAAIAAREQNMKERNMRLQAPLAMAQTFTGALGQWQDLEHKRNILSEQKLTNEKERRLMDLRILKETIEAKTFAEFLQLDLDTQNFVLQNKKNLAPHQLAEQIARASEAKRSTAYNLKMEDVREEVERSGLDFAKENLTKLQNTNKREPWELALLGYQVESARVGDTQTKQKYEDWTEFREKFGFPPELAKEWEYQNLQEKARKVETAIQNWDGPIDADAMAKILGDNFDINFVQSITTLLRAKTTMESKHGMQGTYASVISGVIQKSGVQKTLQDNLRIQISEPGYTQTQKDDAKLNMMNLGEKLLYNEQAISKITNAWRAAEKTEQNPNGLAPTDDWSAYGFYVASQIESQTRMRGEDMYANWLASRKADEPVTVDTVDTVGTVDLPTEAGGPPPLGSSAPGVQQQPLLQMLQSGPMPGGPMGQAYQQGLRSSMPFNPAPQQQPLPPQQQPHRNYVDPSLAPQPPAPMTIPDLGFIYDIPM